ncbi:hypothetical protein JXA88_04740, partial [Candidatus Fermentibacteria bacterium]|nr:hypothetical protein [Candidatus Fermentibacteria bacterium]
MRRTSFGRSVVAALITLFASVAFCEDHSGTIGTETWTLANSPHHITGNVTVGNGATLTIEPGCDVRFNGNYKLRVDGVLIADGDPANHITFTSN